MLLTNDKIACPMQSDPYYYSDSFGCIVSTNSGLFANVYLLEQTKTIVGAISDTETARPIAGAIIKIATSKKATVSDEKGYFKIDVSHSLLNLVLEISSVEYESLNLALQGKATGVSVINKSVQGGKA